MIHGIWSDPHFFHKRIIEHGERPFSSLEEMHEAFIANYNQVIGPNDTCLWVGDCFFGRPVQWIPIMKRLNGIKALVLGNHDRSPATMFEVGFSFVAHEMFMKIGTRRVRVKHFPYWRELPSGKTAVDWHGVLMDEERLARARASAPPRVDGEILIHGHTHNSKRRRDNMIHVGVDAWNYRPASWDEIVAEVAKI